MTGRSPKTMWWNKPLRIVQTVLREPDIKQYDPEAVINYLNDVKANVLVVNGGGIVAFYNSRVKPHYKNCFAEPEQDILKKLIPLAHSHDIKVITRVDFRGAKKYIYDQYPEWFSRKADGSPHMTAGIYAACPNSPYRQKHALEIIKELLEDYQVDGIWENAASFGGKCHCKYCQEKFEKTTGEDIPEEENWDNPVFRRYHQWRHNCKSEQSKLWKETIKSCGEKAYCSEYPALNMPGWAFHGALDIDKQAKYFDFLLGCCFIIGRGSCGSPLLQNPIWNSLELIKHLRSAAPAKTPVALFSHLKQTSRYTSEPAGDLSFYLQAGLAAGGSFWDCTFVGQHPGQAKDRRNIPIIREYFNKHQKREDLLNNVRNAADIALVHSHKSQDRFGDDNPDKDDYVTHVRGWEKVLLENQLAFTIIPDSKITEKHLEKFSCIILANTACLSDEQCSLLLNYLKKGGRIIATFETSLYDENWNKRQDFGISKGLGIKYRGITSGSLPSSYLWVKGERSFNRVFGDTDMIDNNGKICYIKAKNETETVITLTPEIHQQHPENAWLPEYNSGNPVVTFNKFHQGKAAYLANQTDKNYFTDGDPDYSTLLLNTIKEVFSDKDFTFQTEAPACVYAEYLEQVDQQGNPQKLLISLINVSGSPGRPLKEPIPVTDIKVKINQEKYDKFKDIYLLSDQKKPDYHEEDKKLIIKIEELKSFLTICIEL